MLILSNSTKFVEIDRALQYRITRRRFLQGLAGPVTASEMLQTLPSMRPFAPATALAQEQVPITRSPDTLTPIAELGGISIQDAIRACENRRLVAQLHATPFVE